MREKRANGNSHPEKDRIKAFDSYRDTRSIKKTSDETGISANTIKMWRRRFLWDQKLEDEQAEFSRGLSESLDSIKKVAGSLKEIDKYKVASQTPLSVASSLSVMPKITSTGVVTEITGEDLEVLASKAFVAREITTLQLLETIAKEAIEDGKLKPKSMKEVLDVLRYISDRYDKLIDRLIGLNKNESQQDDENFVYVDVNDDGDGSVVRADDAMFFQDAMKKKREGDSIGGG